MIVFGVIGLHFTAITGMTMDRVPWSTLVACGTLVPSIAVATVQAWLVSATFAPKKAEAVKLQTLRATLDIISNSLIVAEVDRRINLWNRQIIDRLQLEDGGARIDRPKAIYVTSSGRHDGQDAARISQVVAHHISRNAFKIVCELRGGLSILPAPQTAKRCIDKSRSYSPFRA